MFRLRPPLEPRWWQVLQEMEVVAEMKGNADDRSPARRSVIEEHVGFEQLNRHSLNHMIDHADRVRV